MPIDVGSRLGHYDVTALIGEGGHGEVYRDRGAQLGCDVAVFDPRPGLERLYHVLERESRGFDGPVVLAVGDTHVFRVDKPSHSADTGLLIENFTRVEPLGHPYVHWVRVQVDPLSDEVFSFQQQIVQDNVGGAGEL